MVSRLHVRIVNYGFDPCVRRLLAHDAVPATGRTLRPSRMAVAALLAGVVPASIYVLTQSEGCLGLRSGHNTRLERGSSYCQL